MQSITLYKYKRADGGVTISPVKPDGEYNEMVRLVADEGKVLTNDGENFTYCIDTDTAEGWYEVDEPKDGTTYDDSKAAEYENQIDYHLSAEPV